MSRRFLRLNIFYILAFRLVADTKTSYYYSLMVMKVSWAPNPKNNTLKKSTKEEKIFEAQYFILFLALRLVTDTKHQIATIKRQCGCHVLPHTKNNTFKGVK